mgnify:CR=1 FL=1
MTAFTLNGATYNTDDFLNYGYKVSVTAGTGQVLPRWTAALVDGAAECNASGACNLGDPDGTGTADISAPV